MRASLRCLVKNLILDLRILETKSVKLTMFVIETSFLPPCTHLHEALACLMI